MKQWVIVDWRGSPYDTGGETFDSQTDAETWIETFVNQSERDDLYTMEVSN